MILPPPPRSGHELVVFLVDGSVVHQPWLAAGVDGVVAAARRSPAAPNHGFAWVLLDTTVRGLCGWQGQLSGRALAGTARRLLTGPAASPAALDAGLAAAYQMARSFLDQRDDGLPAAVDLLAVLGPHGDCRGPGHTEVASDYRVQLAIAGYGEPGPAPDGLDHTRISGPDLVAVWTAARSRNAARRRPRLVLG
ncbi:hypothetical protein [Micromonospora sp. WMMD736]|uniref:hypothetical protein n=1 Tax=Micromonospora sp. WMMD736 TaxID=3404112 RepID=UPI003B959FC2